MVKYSWIVNIYICLFTEPDDFQENIPTHVHSNRRKILLQCLPMLVQYIQTEGKSCYSVNQCWSNTFKQKENPATMFTNVGPIHSNRRKILLQCLPRLVPYIQTEGKSCYNVYQCWSNTFKQKENPATMFTKVGPIHSNRRKILLQCLPRLVPYIQTEGKSCYNVNQGWSHTFKQKENLATMFTKVGPILSNRRKILLQCLPMLVQYIQTEGKSCYSIYQCWSNTFKQRENPATVFTSVGPIHSNRRKILLQCFPMLVQYIQTVGKSYYSVYQCWSITFKQKEDPATMFTNVGPIHSHRRKILLQCLPMLVKYIQTVGKSYYSVYQCWSITFKQKENLAMLVQYIQKEGKSCYNVYQCWSNTFKKKENLATMITNVGPIHSKRRKILLQCLPMLVQYIQTEGKSCYNVYQCWSNTFKQKENPAAINTNVGPIQSNRWKILIQCILMLDLEHNEDSSP